MDFQNKTNPYCVQETHFKKKDSDRLILKNGERYTNINQKKEELYQFQTKLTSEHGS